MARSPDVAAALALVGSFVVLGVAGPWMLGQLREVVAGGLTIGGRPELTPTGVEAIGRHALVAVVLLTAPVLAAALLIGVASNVAQVGLRATPHALKPSFSKISPIAGVKRLFGPNAVFEFGKNLLKLTAIGTIAFLSVRSEWSRVLLLSDAEAEELLVFTGKLSLAIAVKIGGALAVLALVDYAWQRRQTRKQLMMTKQEVRDEAKQTDMNPILRGRLKQAQRAATRSRMLSAVPAADVVVTNPTHFAVALSYEGGEGAPKVVAKGRDLVAARIREVAEEHGVPRVENPPLARALYKTVDIGREIPEELFAAVAEVLAFVYRLQQRRPGAA